VIEHSQARKKSSNFLFLDLANYRLGEMYLAEEVKFKIRIPQASPALKL
jgi:hypothetical protein